MRLYVVQRLRDASAMVAHKRDKTLKRVTLTLDPDDYAAIDQLAHRSDLSSSWLIRRAVREFLERHTADEPLKPFPLEDDKE